MDWFLYERDLRHERVKVKFSPSKKGGFMHFNGSPFNMMENAFYFI